MLLAAGRGERLRPLTDTQPKALIEVHGRSLLERHLQMLHTAGVATVVINLGWLGDEIVRRVGSGKRYGLDVVYSPEGDNILETGGGIHKALPVLGEETVCGRQCRHPDGHAAATTRVAKRCSGTPRDGAHARLSSVW